MSTPSGVVPPDPAWGMALRILAVVAVCLGTARFAYGHFVPLFRAELRLTTPVVGAVGAVGPLGYLAAAAGSWILMDRAGARVTTAVAGLTAAAGMAIVAVTDGLGGLSAGVFVAGLGTALVVPPSVTVASWLGRGELGRLVAFGFVVATGVGVAAIPLLARVGGGGRPAWGVLATLGIGATAWSFVGLPGRQRGKRSHLPAAIPQVGDGPPRRLHLGIAAGLAGATSSTMWVFGPAVLERAPAAGMPTTSTWLFVGLGILAALGLRGALRVVDPSRSFAAAILLLGLATAAFGATTSPWLSMTAATAFGTSYAVTCSALLRWGGRVTSADAAGGVRFAILMLMVGHATGAAVVGELLALQPRAEVFAGVGVVALGAASLGPASGILVWIGQRLRAVLARFGRAD